MSILIERRDRRVRARSRQGTAGVGHPRGAARPTRRAVGLGELEQPGLVRRWQTLAGADAPRRQDRHAAWPALRRPPCRTPRSAPAYRNTSSAANHVRARALRPILQHAAPRRARARAPMPAAVSSRRPESVRRAARGAARRRPRGTDRGRVSRNPRKSRSRRAGSQAQAAAPAARQRVVAALAAAEAVRPKAGVDDADPLGRDAEALGQRRFD